MGRARGLGALAVLLGASLAVTVGVEHWLDGRPFARGLARPSPTPRPPPTPRSEPDPAVRTPAEAATPPPRSEPARAPSAPDRAGTADLLVVGLDRRPGRVGGRSDTLMLVFLDDVRGRAGLVSVPRDLLVEVPGHGEARINATLRIARRLGVDGPALLQRVVEDTLGVRTGHVVLVDVSGFEALVDAAGGIELDVPCPIVDDFEDPRTPSGRRVLDVAAGARSLDGPTAAMYVRSRHGRSDFARARRQQAVLEALAAKLASPSGVLRLPAVLAAAESLLETSMSRRELWELARRVKRVNRAAVYAVVLGSAHTEPYRTPDGRSVLQPLAPAIQDAIAGLFQGSATGARRETRSCPPADVALRVPRRRHGNDVADSVAVTGRSGLDAP